MSSFVSLSWRSQCRPLVSHPNWSHVEYKRWNSSSSSKASASTSTSSDSDSASTNSNTPSPASDGLKPLARPLGVLEKPSSKRKSRTERLKEVLTNDSAIAEQRKHLVKEAVTKGYFHDLNMTRRNGGKTWIAPKMLIREDKALYFPNISGKALSDDQVRHTTLMCFGRISVLSMLSTKISEYHTAGFTSPTVERYSSHPLFQHIRINLQENLLKSILVSLFTSSLRSQTPIEQHANYIVSSQNMEYEREAIGMTNNRVGYVYLVDENLKIRWAGCADANVEEAKSLEICTGVLLKRLEDRDRNFKKAVERVGQELEKVDS